MGLTLYHWILIAAFIGIVIWVFAPKRKARLEKEGELPLDDEES
jgi:cbb3-type cytochrome oxidase subunit 3